MTPRIYSSMVLGAVLVLGQGCLKTATAPSSTVKANDSSASGADTCGDAAMAQRRADTYARTKDCVVEAASIGIADKLNFVGESVKETKDLVDKFKAAAATINAINNLSSARAVLCVKVVTDYITVNSAKSVLSGAITGVAEADAESAINDSIETAKAAGIFGASEVFRRFNEATSSGTAEAWASFGAEVMTDYSDLASFVTSCGPLVAPDVSLAQTGLAVKALGNLGAAGSAFKCVIAVAGNANDVANEAMCLRKDLATIEQQKVSIRKALAFEGSRLYNQARFDGCGCVDNSQAWYNSGATSLDKCRGCCDSHADSPTVSEPKTKATWNAECRLSCGVAYTSGVFTTYLDAKTCDDVKHLAAEKPETIVYRPLNLTDSGDSRPRADQVRAWRGRLLAGLDSLYSNFTNIDPDHDGFLTLQELVACSTNADPALADACTVFGTLYKGADGTPYFLSLLTTAGNVGSKTTRVTQDDLKHFSEEVTRFIDESEFP